jgi:hypothetical protein
MFLDGMPREGVSRAGDGWEGVENLGLVPVEFSGEAGTRIQAVPPHLIQERRSSPAAAEPPCPVITGLRKASTAVEPILDGFPADHPLLKEVPTEATLASLDLKTLQGLVGALRSLMEDPAKALQVAFAQGAAGEGGAVERFKDLQWIERQASSIAASQKAMVAAAAVNEVLLDLKRCSIPGLVGIRFQYDDRSRDLADGPSVPNLSIGVVDQDLGDEFCWEDRSGLLSVEDPVSPKQVLLQSLGSVLVGPRNRELVILVPKENLS